MKNIVRTFVAVLCLTGVAATSQTYAASAKSNKVSATRVDFLPVPTCPPNDPNACGMGH